MVNQKEGCKKRGIRFGYFRQRYGKVSFRASKGQTPVMRASVERLQGRAASRGNERMGLLRANARAPRRAKRMVGVFPIHHDQYPLLLERSTGFVNHGRAF